MGVSRMKLATIVGPVETFDAVVQSCIVGREFHPEPATTIMNKVKGLYPFEPVNPYLEPLHHAERLFAATGLAPDFREFSDTEMTLSVAEDYLSDFERRFDEFRLERELVDRRQMENRQILLQLENLRDVTVPIQDLFMVTYIKFRFGRMPREIYDGFNSLIKARDDVFFFITDEQRDFVYGMYMTPRASMEKVDGLFASLQFERIRLSGRLRGSSEEAEASIRKDIEDSQARLAELDVALGTLLEKESQVLLQHYSYLRFMSSAYGVRQYAAHSNESFYLLGWVPEERLDEFDRSVSEWKDANSVLVFEDADALVGYTPPTRLRNPKVFRPFESFAAMYGLPAYNEIDPTPLMAVVYPLIFGVMFGDIGHGLLLAAIGALMWRLKKMWLGKVLLYCSVFSVGFGFVYGSIFGNEHLLRGFKVLESSETTQLMMTVTIYAGAGLVALAIIMNVLNGVRQKNMEKIFFGTNSIVGLFLYAGIVFTVLPFLGFGRSPLPMPVLLLFIALPLVLVFFREPLSQWAERKKVHLEGGAGNFFLSNAFEMLEILLSFVTNTISFMRVGAYAVSHASMMTVVYTLAQAADGSHNILVLILGNVIVAGIEALLVGIQVLRLQFYEIFGRFYSGAGRPFAPLVIDYKDTREK